MILLKRSDNLARSPAANRSPFNLCYHVACLLAPVYRYCCAMHLKCQQEQQSLTQGKRCLALASARGAAVQPPFLNMSHYCGSM